MKRKKTDIIIKPLTTVTESTSAPNLQEYSRLSVVLQWEYLAWKIETNNKAFLVSILPLLASPQNLYGCFLGWALWLHTRTFAKSQVLNPLLFLLPPVPYFGFQVSKVSKNQTHFGVGSYGRGAGLYVVCGLSQYTKFGSKAQFHGPD